MMVRFDVLFALPQPFLQGKYGSDQQGDDQSDRPLVDGQRM